MSLTVQSLLDQPGVAEILSKAHPSDASVTDLVQQVRQIDPKISTVRLFCYGTHFTVTWLMQIEQLLNVRLGLTKNEWGTPLFTALKALSDRTKHLKSSLKQNTTSHHEKCSFVSFAHIQM
jgi:glycosylphosphatidylinositol transamidase (GPIT) subunit GPI8